MKSDNSRLAVLLLDGENRSSLAVLRSLGQRGIRVYVGQERSKLLCSNSRYCKGSILYQSPQKNPVDFLKNVNKYVASHQIGVLIPTGDIALSILLQNREHLSGIRFPFVTYDIYKAVTNKMSLFRNAEEAGIPIPHTIYSDEYSSTDRLVAEAHQMGFPVVIKPFQSRIETRDGWINAIVRYAYDTKELLRLVGEDPFRSNPFLVQKKIIGSGIGIFLLMRDGETLASFAHRRIREKPPSGGVSVLCESIVPSQEALRSAENILAPLGWTGVAMVEFKLDHKDGVHKLIEVNARFWGSLQLAVSAGVDFPYLLYKLSIGEPTRGPSKYICGLKSRWELGDLDHLLLRLRRSPEMLGLGKDAPTRWETLRDFTLDFFRSDVRHEVFRLDDPGPFIHELSCYIRDILRKAGSAH